MKAWLYLLSCGVLAATLRTASAGVDDAPATSAIAAFEQAVRAAHQEDSGGGSTITRAELRSAIAFFLFDDGQLGADERRRLTSFLASAPARQALSGSARTYAEAFLELHEESAPASLSLAEPAGESAEEPAATVEALLGITGPLVASLWVQEGRSSGAISQLQLRAAFGRAFGASAGTFDPINQRELRNELAGRLELGTPTRDELAAVVAYVTKGATRFYLAPWVARDRGGERGDLGGVVVAAVSADRRWVRLVEVHAWTD